MCCKVISIDALLEKDIASELIYSRISATGYELYACNAACDAISFYCMTVRLFSSTSSTAVHTVLVATGDRLQ